MTLAELAQSVDGIELRGSVETELDYVTHDSREVRPGTLFVALSGRQRDGLEFVPQALQKGASAIAVPQGTAPLDLPVPCLILPEPRKNLAQLAAAIHEYPGRKLRLFGITGTNGKSTVAVMLGRMLRASGISEGIIGTIFVDVAGQEEPARFTTPESPQLHAILKRMTSAGVKSVAMEVSSIAISENRVFGLSFQGAAFLNLSEEHLDYHRDMASYAEAKGKLFDSLLADDGLALINIEDVWGVALNESLTENKPQLSRWTMAVRNKMADLHFESLDMGRHGIAGTLRTPMGGIRIQSPLVGEFNAANIMAAVGLGLHIGLSPENISSALETITVPGRMEPVPHEGDFLVLVDYAHTADALARALEVAKALAHGKVWCLFGCGGDRDRLKRSPMGEAASIADGVVVTNDNPRSEDPEAIALAAAAGCETGGLTRLPAPGAGGYWIQLDRAKAIEEIIGCASSGDVVLIAGKGHELYQEFASGKEPFDDLATARFALAAREAQ